MMEALGLGFILIWERLIKDSALGFYNETYVL